MTSQVEFDRNALSEICERYHVARLSFFGSVLRSDFGPQSDLDLLVEFGLARTPGFSFFALQDELSDLFGRKADLVTRDFLSRYFRDDVTKNAEPVYVAG